MRYKIHIECMSTWADSLWVWSVYSAETEKCLHGGDATFRWSGIRAAKRWCRKHANGKLKPPDDGSRTIVYEV